MKCRICDNTIDIFLSLGKMPIANGFILEKDFEKEYFFNLATAICDKCLVVQLETQPKPSLMFHENYAFYSKTSKYMQLHFKNYAEWILDNFLPSKESFIIELGSNDGILLENFSNKNINHLGIEPSKNVASVAKKNGINTRVDFFSLDVANNVIKEFGKADVITAANVMCHIPDLNQVAEACNLLLKDQGVLIFEDPYLGDMIEKISYDQIYDEHVYLFSAMSVQNIFKKFNLQLIDLLPQTTHGGSMRYILSKNGARPITNNVAKIIAKEKKIGLDKKITFDIFKKNCELSKNKILKLLNNLKIEKKKIIGYGAASKSTTILNYCQIGPELIDFICDTTPIKQNKFSPGMHIPVKPYEEFLKYKPDIAFLFAWNHKKEIEEKEAMFIKNGGQFISHIF